MCSRLALVALVLCNLGFEWPGHIGRLEQALEHGSPAERRDAARRLQREPQSASAAAILRALEDADRDVRLEVAALAAHSKTRPAVPILLGWLSDRDQVVRASAIAALGQLGDPQALPALARSIEDPAAAARREAISALGQAGARDALEGIKRHTRDPDAQVRVAAITALARLAGAQSLATLTSATSDPERDVRLAAIDALGDSGDARAVSPLARMLPARDESSALAAARALGRLGRPEAARALSPFALHDHGRTTLAALSALGRIDSDAARSTLVSALLDAQLREPATLALMQQARRHAGTVVQPPGKDGPGAADLDATPSTAATAPPASIPKSTPAPLSNTAPPRDPSARVVQPLTAALHAQRSASAKAAVAGALAELAALVPIPGAVPELLATLARAEPELAAPCMLALARSAQPELLPSLLARLDQPGSLPLQPVLDALSIHFRLAELRGRTPDARAQWFANLSDPQRNALEPWLGDQGRAAARMLAHLDSATHAQRVQLVQLLGQLGDTRALPALLALRTDADSALRLATLAALGTIGTQQGAPALIAELGAPDAPTRTEAALALSKTADGSTLSALLTRLPLANEAEAGAILHALGGALRRLRERQALDPQLATAAAARIVAFVGHRNDALAAAAIAALGQWGPAGAVSTLAQVLRQPGSTRAAAAIAAIGHARDPEARALLHYLLENASGREATAAAVALGEIGDQRDVPELLRVIQRLPWPTPGAAAFALARMVERGVLRPYAAQRDLCMLAASRQPHVPANAIAGLARLAAPPCPDSGPDPRALLATPSAPIVQAAAARWLHGASQAGHIEPAIARAALDTCLASASEELTLDACNQPALPLRYEPVEVQASTRAAGQVLPQRLISIVLSSGAVYVGYTDANGRVQLEAAPAGDMLLQDPALLPLDVEAHAALAQ